MDQIKLEGCIYELTINNRPYIGQSRVLDSSKLPIKRWKRHIADSKIKGKKLYLHNAICANNLTYDTLNKNVIEYIEHTIECHKDILLRFASKKDKQNYKKYITILTNIFKNDDTNIEEINEYIENEDELTEEEVYIVKQIELFIKKLNDAEEKWVNEKKSMMPSRGGNGYNHAPPGGALLHEAHTEEHKQYMSDLFKGRQLSDETKELLRKARIGKPLSDIHKDAIAKTSQLKFNLEIFPKRYEEWVKQYNKLGYSPDSNSKDADERRAGQWRQDMIAKRKCNGCKYGLTEEQINKLTHTLGWLWEQPDEFSMQFENFKKQYALCHGKLDTNAKDPTNEAKWTATCWIRRIRGMKKTNDPYLTEERINALNNCEYWMWNSTSFPSFNESVNAWTEFYNINKRQPSMGTNDDNEKKIARWQSRIRMKYNNQHKSLTNDKIEQLSSLLGWTWKGK